MRTSAHIYSLSKLWYIKPIKQKVQSFEAFESLSPSIQFDSLLLHWTLKCVRNDCTLRDITFIISTIVYTELDIHMLVGLKFEMNSNGGIEKLKRVLQIFIHNLYIYFFRNKCLLLGIEWTVSFKDASGAENLIVTIRRWTNEYIKRIGPVHWKK